MFGSIGLCRKPIWIRQSFLLAQLLCLWLHCWRNPCDIHRNIKNNWGLGVRESENIRARCVRREAQIHIPYANRTLEPRNSNSWCKIVYLSRAEQGSLSVSKSFPPKCRSEAADCLPTARILEYYKRNSLSLCKTWPLLPEWTGIRYPSRLVALSWLIP